MLEKASLKKRTLAPEAEALLESFPPELQERWGQEALKEDSPEKQVRTLTAALTARNEVRQAPSYLSSRLRMLKIMPESLRVATEHVEKSTVEVNRGNNGKILACMSDSLSGRPVVYKALLKSDILAKKRLVTEASFHADVAHLAQEHPEIKIGVPAIYYFLSHKDVHAFALEFLSTAVSVEDVLLGRKTLPSSCDLEEVFDAVQKFVALMNQNNFWHQDLHVGNIMIETSGDPTKPLAYVIDFGGCTYSFDDPKKRGDIDKSSDYVSVEVVKRQLVQYLNAQSQGVPNI